MDKIENDRLARLQTQLERMLQGWSLPPGFDVDELVAESTEVLWRFEQREAAQCMDPMRFLLATAKRKRMELLRRQRKGTAGISQIEPTSGPSVNQDLIELIEPSDTPSQHIVDVNHWNAWNELPPKQKRVLGECLMFERNITEVAAEVGVCRSTAKSWISRITKRLARDPFILEQFNKSKNGA